MNYTLKKFHLMEFPEIHFGGDNPKLRSYKKYKWLPGETRIIEFYSNENVPVTLLYSSDPSLYDKLSTLIDGYPISIDLEWAQPWNHSPHPIELFQFSSSKGTIVVASDQNKGYDQIAHFLHSTKFFGKGMSNDKVKLQKCCNENFDDIEDIEQTRLLPNNLTINFESLTMMFLGPGMAKFKDHKVQRSNWSVRPLSILQILYGAHDSYSMLKVYKKIIEKFGSEIKKVPVKPKNEKNKKKAKSIYTKCDCHFIDIDDYFSKKNVGLDYDRPFGDDEILCEKNPSVKKLIFESLKKKCNDGSVTDEDSCFLQHADHILTILLPTQKKDKRYLHLERICLASDLLFLGIEHHLKNETFVCQVCDKYLQDPVALINHSECRHCNDISVNHNLKSKDVFLHYLTAIDQVKCPFKIVFENSQLKNLVVEEPEEEDEEDDDDDDDDDEDLLNNAIVPKSYNESDGIKCCICNQNFESIENLKDHCWLTHYEQFEKLITGKGYSQDKQKDDQKLNQFCLLLVKKLNLGTVNQDNFSIKCNVCDFVAATPAKFFMHVIFKHRKFAIVNKDQYKKWPIRYEEFNDQMIKVVQDIGDEIDFNELEINNLYNKNENKCSDCNITFNNDEEKMEHYVKNHLIYFPIRDNQSE